jgi:hypothetical protein
VFGPLNFTMTGCNTSALATALRPMIPGTFDHLPLVSRLARLVLQLVGSGVERDARSALARHLVQRLFRVRGAGSGARHNFGMKHSSFMKCPNAAFVDNPYDTATMTSTCMHSEYGDRYDPMGSGCRHMNSYQKAYQGWFGKCNVVDVTASGTFTLLPLELPCDGIQVLQIPMPHTRPFFRSGGGGSSGVTELTHYFLEFRASTGIDKGLTPSVQVRVSGDIKMRTQRGLNTWFLDMNPATSTLDGLTAGGTFTDPAGSVKFTIDAIEPTKATVRVEFQGGGQGAPKCMDDSLLEAPGPVPRAAPPPPRCRTARPRWPPTEAPAPSEAVARAARAALAARATAAARAVPRAAAVVAARAAAATRGPPPRSTPRPRTGPRPRRVRAARAAAWAAAARADRPARGAPPAAAAPPRRAASRARTWSPRMRLPPRRIAQRRRAARGAPALLALGALLLRRRRR